MNDREPTESIATRVVGWQYAAQHLPLPDLRATVADWQNELAQSLNAFNDICAVHADGGVPADMFELALGQVTRLATATAILTLGISQRTCQAARQN